uniref:ubiquitinyl hydrolase 1 n=1 Tax=Compsopogon caeruleus TaxID=31354 RepID=A0A7S1TJF4_9RHOD|mmetsp:Transcript_7227/g.14859  ORF Transcript_7227/g.14859 Transcript_7227/m.14859 type:complete len:1202 (+) Transcript_7227:108-3713(+)
MGSSLVGGRDEMEVDVLKDRTSDEDPMGDANDDRDPSDSVEASFPGNTRISSNFQVGVEGPTGEAQPNPASEQRDATSFDFIFPFHEHQQLKTQKTWSPAHPFSGLFWRLLIFPNGNDVAGYLSLYLECTKAEDNTRVTLYENDWSRYVSFKLIILDQRREEDGHVDITLERSFDHRFREDDKDWGYTEYIHLSRLKEETGLCVNGKIHFRVEMRLLPYVAAGDSIYGFTDSRKETGFVGFKNQGATCYMNSLLQTLYNVAAFRRVVYRLPLSDSGEVNGSPNETSYALQKVFYELQYSPTVVRTKKLTESFGWDNADSFTQHDVQELNRILCDHLEEKMKKLPGQQNSIARLFQGKLLNFIECVKVDYKSTREESFYDISLNVKGCRNLRESFLKYTEVELMDGENRYRADGFEELQDAKKGIRFLKFPPILQLHLKRFEYDFTRDVMVKINDRFEFGTELDLSEFVDDENSNNLYLLHAVLVHIGDVHGGHYYAYIRPDFDSGQWYKFDDEIVEKCKPEQAVTENFGIGPENRPDDDASNIDNDASQTIYPPRRVQARRYSNAYMLQYIRKDALQEILGPVKDEDIPLELRNRIQAEKEEEEQRKRERAEQHLYITLYVATEDDFRRNEGPNLVAWDTVQRVRVKRVMLLRELKDYLVGFNCVKEGVDIRLWKCNLRKNGAIRPENLLAEGFNDRTIFEADGEAYPSLPYPRHHDDIRELKLFAEVLDHNPPFPFTELDHMLICVKMYSSTPKPSLRYLGCVVVRRNDKVSRIVALLRETRDAPEPDSNSIFFVELRFSQVEVLLPDRTFEENRMSSGDIIVYQPSAQLSVAECVRNGSIGADLPLGGKPILQAPDYYCYLENRIEVEFRERSNPNDAGIVLELLKTDDYAEVRRRLGLRSGLDPDHLRFYPFDICTDGPRNDPVSKAEGSSLDMMLNDALAFSVPFGSERVLWYEVTDYSFEEFSKNLELRIGWRPDRGTRSTQGRLEEGSCLPPSRSLSVLVPRGSTFKAVEDEIRVRLQLPAMVEIRLVEINNFSIKQIIDPSTELVPGDNLNWDIRAEPVPIDQTEKCLGEDNLLISIIHLAKDTKGRRPSSHSSFGDPFLMRVPKSGIKVQNLRDQIQELLIVEPEEFTQWRMAVVEPSLALSYLEAEDFWNIAHSASGSNRGGLIQLALEHKNDTPPAPVKRQTILKPLSIRR